MKTNTKQIILPIVITFFLFSGLTQAKDISQIEDEINQPPASNVTTNDNDKDEDDGGKYKKDVKVLDHGYEFVYYRFGPVNFQPWIDLMSKSKAYETYIDFLKNGWLSPHGVVETRQVSEMFHGRFLPRTILTIDLLKDFFKSVYSTRELYKHLQEQNILNESGYIVGADDFSGAFAEQKFDFLFERLKKLDIPIEDVNLRNKLLRELHHYMMSESKVEVTKTLETTHYESGKEGFWDSFVDTLAGNALGSIFYPDKVKTQKNKSRWTPNLDIEDHFGLFYGLNDFPFNYKQGYTVLLYRNLEKTRLTLGIAQNENLFNDSLDYRYYRAMYSFGQSVAFYNTGFNVFQMRQADTTFQFYNGYIGVGVTSPRTQFNVDIGLSYKRGIDLSGLGFYWGLGFEMLAINPVSLTFKFDGGVQPNLITGKSNWRYSELYVGAQAQVGPFAAGAGYQWSTGFDGWMATLSTTF